MQHFTPISATIGGLLIGFSAAMLWLGLGRVAGISGIVGGFLKQKAEGVAWRIAFVVGLVAAPVLYGLVGGVVPQIELTHSLPAIISGGFLVGFGTRLGGGCTSGHGVCGFARLSPRSVVATLTFMACGVLTVYVARHLIGV